MFDIAMVRARGELRCFVTMDKKSEAREAIKIIQRGQQRVGNTFEGTVVNCAYKDRNGKTMKEGSNKTLVCTVEKHKKKRNKVVVEGIETTRSYWQGDIIEQLRRSGIINDKELEEGEIEEMENIKGGS